MSCPRCHDYEHESNLEALACIEVYDTGAMFRATARAREDLRRREDFVFLTWVARFEAESLVAPVSYASGDR